MKPNPHPAYATEQAIYEERAKVTTPAELTVWALTRRETMQQMLNSPDLQAEVRDNLAASLRFLSTVV